MHDKFFGIVKGLNEFTIPYKGLKEGSHLFDFDVKQEFFEEFEGSEIQSGDLKVVLNLEKREHFLKLDFEIQGTVDVLCDRCLDELSLDVETKEVLYIKFGETEEEQTEEIIVLPHEEYEYNVGQFIYDSINLNLPYQRVHPEDEEGYTACNQEMLNKLDEHLVDEEKEENTDPRWDELKNLLGNN